jgi:hypothetical protein
MQRRCALFVATVGGSSAVTTVRVDGNRLELQRQDGTLAETLQRAAEAQ